MSEINKSIITHAYVCVRVHVFVFSGKKYVENDVFHYKNQVFRDSVTNFMQFFEKFACLRHYFEVMS